MPNPIVLQRADPCVLRHDGQYYFTASHPMYDRIAIRRAASLAELQSADEVTVWERHGDGPQSHLVWAPELHRVGEAWYLYFAAAPNEHGTADVAGANETFNHRIFVLECTDADPLTGSWAARGQVDTGWESFALDATTFALGGTQYLVWAQQDIAIRGHSNIYIAPMVDPWTLAGPGMLLTRPEHDWETAGFWVNEGPSVLVRNGRVWLTYSGGATGPEYAMGLLVADAGADLLDPASWTKSTDPVFVSSPENGQYGPGHNSFTETEDGDVVLVYHARTYTSIDGDPLWDPNRHARAQVLPFDAAGRPVWGSPVPDDRDVPSSTAMLRPDGTTGPLRAP